MQDVEYLTLMNLSRACIPLQIAFSDPANLSLYYSIDCLQGYGLTESSGSVASTVGPEESLAYGSVGKLASHLQAKIVDPAIGEALGPGQRGELWIRGPVVMKGER
jgi:long-subunit acyl-CoA synthetase (AMP-forming)